MKYIAYEGTYNEQIYDTKTGILSWDRTGKTIQCNGSKRPDLKMRVFSGKRIWVKMTRNYYKIKELEALIELNEMIIVDYPVADAIYQYKIAENASFKAKIKKLK